MSKKRLFKLIPLKADKQPFDFQGQTVNLNVYDLLKQCVVVRIPDPFSAEDAEKLRKEILRNWRGKNSPGVIMVPHNIEFLRLEEIEDEKNKSRITKNRFGIEEDGGSVDETPKKS